MAIFHEYPYTNFHDLNLDWIIKIVKELKAIVDTIDVDSINSHFATIDGILAEHTADIAELQAQSTSAAAAISALQTTVSSMEVDITQIHSQIDGVIDQISAAVSELTGDVSALETELGDYKTATNSRLATLEEAAFDPSQIVMSNMPFNFALSMLDGAKNGVKIVVDESVGVDDSIQWVDGGTWYVTNVPDKQRFLQWHKIPRFFNSGNPCHLVIPSVFPNVFRTGASWTLYFYCHRWAGEWSDNSGLNKVGPVTFTEILADGGKQITATPDTGPFNDMELVKNETTGCYDLHIYNGRHGYTYYGDVMFDNMMILPINLGNEWEGTTKQKYYNLLNTYLIQSTSNIDGRINSALAPVTSEVDELEGELAKCLTWEDLRVMDFTPLSGVTIVSNNSRQLTGVLGSKRASLLFIDMQIDVSNLVSDSATSIGQLDLYMSEVTNGRSIVVAIEGANSGAFGSMSSNGSLTIKAFGTFGETTRMRITGTIADIHEYVPT